MMNDTYHRLKDFYAQGGVPWDDALPPPEVIQEIEMLPPGRALDLGCGYGRASIYMARRGWQVDAVDFVPQAITVARLRAAAAGVHIRFHLTPVTQLQSIAGPIDFALDVGCAHALDFTGLTAYHAELTRLLRPGARYMLFARLREEEEPAGENGPRGLYLPWLKTIFMNGFMLKKEEIGRTDMLTSSWASGWFWFTRQASA